MSGAKPSQLDDMEVLVDPMVEWQQMYVDGWRILRDWFYDPNMHGQDWDEIRSKYEPLVQHVAHRADLDYIFGEIAGEMNAGHIYVQSGDKPSVERRNGGLLGAEFERQNGFYRVSKIFKGEAWQTNFFSPLAVPGINVSVGDYVIAINGVSTAGAQNFYQLLENTGGDIVTLTVNDNPRERDSRDVMVKTITSETQLRYLDWVEERARRVDELSGGRIAYVHLPNTAGDAFPYYFKKLGLGALIGTRTWGGLIGISGNPSLADGGSILASTFRFMDTDGEWAVENEGVSPDIEVVDRPELVAAGQDPTLETAVRHLLEELETSPPTKVEAPASPTDF